MGITSSKQQAANDRAAVQHDAIAAEMMRLVKAPWLAAPSTAVALSVFPGNFKREAAVYAILYDLDIDPEIQNGAHKDLGLHMLNAATVSGYVDYDIINDTYTLAAAAQR